MSIDLLGLPRRKRKIAESLIAYLRFYSRKVAFPIQQILVIKNLRTGGPASKRHAVSTPYLANSSDLTPHHVITCLQIVFSKVNHLSTPQFLLQVGSSVSYCMFTWKVTFSLLFKVLLHVASFRLAEIHAP